MVQEHGIGCHKASNVMAEDANDMRMSAAEPPRGPASGSKES